MIEHLRIDNRLIHGQVAVTWRAAVQAKAIIVCNDQVAADPIQKMALPLAVKGEKVLILTIQELIDYDKKHPDEKKFVICKFPTDCLALLEAGLDINTVNVGNAAPKAGTNFKMVTKSIAVTPEDAAVYRKIADLRGGHLETQMVPTYDKDDFLALLKKAKL
jgi:PTS system mannose-specific IIB component